MPRVLVIAIILAIASLPTGADAQDKYSRYVGDWVASLIIARSCSGMTTLNQEGAGEVARAQEGLRKQKVLRLLYYGKTTSLERAGREALAARGLDASKKQSLCKFGRSVAGKDDRIGRFLREK